MSEERTFLIATTQHRSKSTEVHECKSGVTCNLLHVSFLSLTCNVLGTKVCNDTQDIPVVDLNDIS